MSQWRVVAGYPDEVADERAEADLLVDDYVTTALAVCGHLVANLHAALGKRCRCLRGEFWVRCERVRIVTR